MAVKTLKNLYHLQTDAKTFLERGRKLICEKKNREVTYLVALVMAFLAAEIENRQPEDLPQAYSGRVPERFLLSLRTKSINENFVN